MADLVGARPIDLAVIDGIETNRGGEGPWCRSAEPIEPGLLLVGRNGVCTDAIGDRRDGLRPASASTACSRSPATTTCCLLAGAGVGTIDPKRIEVRGLPLAKAIFPFNPKRLPLDDPAAYCARIRPRRSFN